jgi:cytochrome c
MKFIAISFAFAGVLATSTVFAADMPADGKAKCGACHTISKKAVGPAWADVAAKYKGKADAEATLIANISKGGQFGWKQGTMPAKGLGASDAQIAALAKFIAVDLNK